jgi:hypothetical protein
MQILKLHLFPKNELFLPSGYRLTADFELFISMDGKHFN